MSHTICRDPLAVFGRVTYPHSCYIEAPYLASGHRLISKIGQRQFEFGRPESLCHVRSHFETTIPPLALGRPRMLILIRPT